MKIFQPTWFSLVSFANLHDAFIKAARDKRGKPQVAAFEMKLEKNIFRLMFELKSEKYHPGKYTHFTIHEPKVRVISAAPFRDRIVHHALCNIIEPIFEKKFIFDSYANRVGKGNHRALDRCTQYMRRFQYVLPIDIRKFFPSIDHKVLYRLLADDIQDRKILALCRQIIVSTNVTKFICPNNLESLPLEICLKTDRGLPIGNLTSQFWANVYLNPLDHFIKRDLKCRGYVRYVDDMLLFSNLKSQLMIWKNAVIHFLKTIKLEAHENTAQARPCTSGLPFLGFQVFPDHRRLKRRKAVQARRRIKSIVRDFKDGSIDFHKMDACIRSWISHAEYGDTWGLRRSILQEISL
jgi:retron-type reverse transcriptase